MQKEKDFHSKNEIDLHFWSVWGEAGVFLGENVGYTSEMLYWNHIYPEVPLSLSFPKIQGLELIPNRSVGLGRERKAFRQSCW